MTARTSTFCVAAAAALLFAHSPAPLDAGVITSTFDTDLAGWTVSGDVAFFTRSVSDGNPSPMALIVDAVTGDAFRVVAPPAFLGDLSSFNGGTIAFDSRIISRSGPVLAQFGITRITGNGVTATLDIATSDVTTSWRTYSAPLTAADWGKTDLEWASILSNVSSLDIVVEAIRGAETMGFDNPTLVPIPEPSGLTLIAIAFLLHSRCRGRSSSNCDRTSREATR